MTLLQKREKQRFFLGYLEICGVFRSLEFAIREKGHKAYFLNLGSESRERQTSDPFTAKLFLSVYRLMHSPSVLSSGLRRLTVTVLYKFSILTLLLWIARNFDVIVIKSGNSLTESNLDIRILKLLRKKIIFTFHGSDSRPFYLNGLHTCGGDALLDEQLRQLSNLKEKLTQCAALADYIIDSPTSAHFQQRKCCLRQVIFNPAPLSSFAGKNRNTDENNTLRILHAPSDPALKGSNIIRGIVQNMKAEGYAFDYIELNNVSNERVITELLNSDIIIDETYSDNYGGVFALEGLTAFKIVLVGGYALEHLNAFVPEWARMPTLYNHPNNMEKALKALFKDRRFRAEQRDAARDYIENIAAPACAADRLIRLSQGDAPECWFFNPSDITYCGGATSPLEDVHGMIRKIVEKKGAAALLLADKPKTERALLNMAGIT